MLKPPRYYGRQHCQLKQFLPSTPMHCHCYNKSMVNHLFLLSYNFFSHHFFKTFFLDLNISSFSHNFFPFLVFHFIVVSHSNSPPISKIIFTFHWSFFLLSHLYLSFIFFLHFFIPLFSYKLSFHVFNKEVVTKNKWNFFQQKLWKIIRCGFFFNMCKEKLKDVNSILFFWQGGCGNEVRSCVCLCEPFFCVFRKEVATRRQGCVHVCMLLEWESFVMGFMLSFDVDPLYSWL